MAAESVGIGEFAVQRAWENAIRVDKKAVNSSQLLSSLALALGTHHIDADIECSKNGIDSDNQSMYVALAAALRTPDFVGSFAQESKWASDTPTPSGERICTLRRQSSAQQLSAHEGEWRSLPSSHVDSKAEEEDKACGNCQARGSHAAAFAAYVGHVSCLKALALAGHHSIFDADTMGRTSLFYAAASPMKLAQTDCLRLLLSIDDEWLDIGDIEGDTPLAVAACRGRADAVIELLASGAQIGLANKSGQTPLHACSSPKCLEELIKFAHKDMLYATDVEGRSPLMIMCAQGNSACVEILIRADEEDGTLYLAETGNGNSPLHAAAASGSIDCVKQLVKALELPGLPTNCIGATPVEEAFRAGHLHIAVFLLQYEAWLSGDTEAIVRCKEHLASVQDILFKTQTTCGTTDMTESTLSPTGAMAFNVTPLAVDTDSPSAPRLGPQPLSPAAASLSTQAAWLSHSKMPQIRGNSSAVQQPAAGPAAALPDFTQLRSSKLRLPPLQQSGSKVLSPVANAAAPAAVAIPERRLSGASSVHSRRQSLARQRSLKAAALVELSPMPRSSPVFSDK